jgi:hypothetical protein
MRNRGLLEFELVSIYIRLQWEEMDWANQPFLTGGGPESIILCSP